MAIPKFQDFLYPFLYQLKDKETSNKKFAKSTTLSRNNGVDGIIPENALVKNTTEYNLSICTRKSFDA